MGRRGVGGVNCVHASDAVQAMYATASSKSYIENLTEESKRKW